jgi:hypothetical protein
MNTYTVETDGEDGLQVKVTGPDGRVRLISHHMPTWRAARAWIAEHRRTAGQYVSDARSSNLPSK